MLRDKNYVFNQLQNNYRNCLITASLQGNGFECEIISALGFTRQFKKLCILFTPITFILKRWHDNVTQNVKLHNTEAFRKHRHIYVYMIRSYTIFYMIRYI